MFDLTKITIKDYIIIFIFIVLAFFLYKNYTYLSEISTLKNNLKVLENKLVQSEKLI
jgi:hypothetical protein